MDRTFHRRSFGFVADASPRRQAPEVVAHRSAGGSVVNYLGNPRFRPSVAFKTMSSSPDMSERERLLSQYALLVKEEGR
jgi:hypothetical protein